MMFENLSSEVFFSPPVAYLVPSLAAGLVLAYLRRTWTPLRALHFSGVLVHEMLHLLVGFLTMAKPNSISLTPRMIDGRMVLGSVGFVGLNWWNAWLTGLAPLLALPIIYGAACLRLTHGPLYFQWGDVLIWLLIAPHYVNCWPSREDWAIVLISWPVFALLGTIGGIWMWSLG